MRSTLERLGDRAMPGHDRAEFGAWTARSDEGATGRANSCWVRDEPAIDLVERVEAVERWYAQRGRQPIFQVFEGSDRVVSFLSGRGYTVLDGALVMVAQAPRFATSGRIDVDVSRDLPAGLAGLTGSPERLAESVRTQLDQRIIFGRLEGELVASCNLTIDGAWMGISNLRTSAAHRRQGVGSAVMHHLVRVGNELGAQTFWLQVSPANDPAIAMYQGAGFTVEHRYSYLGLTP